MKILGVCSICGSPAFNSCSLCGRLMCGRHYDPETGLCEVCSLKTKRPASGERKDGLIL